jgi:hypothetical protein
MSGRPRRRRTRSSWSRQCWRNRSLQNTKMTKRTTKVVGNGAVANDDMAYASGLVSCNEEIILCLLGQQGELGGKFKLTQFVGVSMLLLVYSVVVFNYLIILMKKLCRLDLCPNSMNSLSGILFW